MIDEIRPFKERPGALSLILFGLLGWLCAMLQVGFFHRLPLMTAAMPLLCVVCVLVSWRRGEVTGAVLGAVGGLTLDALAAARICLTPLLLIALALYVGWASRRLFDHPVSRLLVGLPPYVCLGVIRGMREHSTRAAFGTFLGAMLLTALLLLPYTVRYIKRR